MRIEICIAKEKFSKMPKGSVPALQQNVSPYQKTII